PLHGVLKRGATLLHSGDTFTGSPAEVTYQPAHDYNGLDSFRFKATDGGDPQQCGEPTATCAAALESNVVTVFITVTPVNDRPSVSAAPPSLTVGEDASATTVTLSGSDVETAAATLVFTITAEPLHG